VFIDVIESAKPIHAAVGIVAVLEKHRVDFLRIIGGSRAALNLSIRFNSRKSPLIRIQVCGHSSKKIH